MHKYKIHVLSKIGYVFDRFSLTSFFLICLGVKILLSGVFATVISSLFPNQLEHPISETSIYEAFVVVVVLAPLFETLIFQFLFFYGGEKLRINNATIIVLSSILFAVSHHISFAYIALTLLSGLFYNIVYLYVKERYKVSTAFLFVVGIHAIYNFVVWCNVELIK